VNVTAVLEIALTHGNAVEVLALTTQLAQVAQPFAKVTVLVVEAAPVVIVPPLSAPTMLGLPAFDAIPGVVPSTETVP
jgi:hypothetical protein